MRYHRQKPPICFGLIRGYQALDEHPLKDEFEVDLSSDPEFVRLRAMRYWGASVEDLTNYLAGNIPPRTLSILSNFYLASTLYDRHMDDAIEIHRDAVAEAKKNAAKNKEL